MTNKHKDQDGIGPLMRALGIQHSLIYVMDDIEMQVWAFETNGTRRPDRDIDMTRTTLFPMAKDDFLPSRLEPDEPADYHAYVPSMPGLHIDGQTQEQARERLQDGISVYLASLTRSSERLGTR